MQVVDEGHVPSRDLDAIDGLSSWRGEERRASTMFETSGSHPPLQRPVADRSSSGDTVMLRVVQAPRASALDAGGPLLENQAG